MSSRTSTRRKRTAGSAGHDEELSNSPSQRSRRDRSPSIVFLYTRKSAPPPFNAPDATLILRTPTGTPFKVNRYTVGSASPLLAGTAQNELEELRNQVLSYRGSMPKCIERDVPESAFVLEALLRYIYFETPVMLDLDDIVDVLAAATKYKIRVAIQGLTKSLQAPCFLNEEPLRVFSIAKKFQLDDPEAIFKRAVLKHPVQWPPTKYDPEHDLDAASRQELYDAVKYRRKITFDAMSLIEDPSRVQQLSWHDVPGGKPPCGGTCWWRIYADRARSALHESPLSDVVCSASFVASVGMELHCAGCREHLIRILLPGGFIEQLKRDIDALPDAMYMYHGW